MDRQNQEKPSSLITPFIHTSDSEEIGQNGLGEVRKNEKGMFSREEIREEVKKQLWLAGPLICVSLLQSCLELISVMFVGHLGELALSGASMAISFTSVTGFSLLLGMSCALDTFCGQSYGAKQYHMVGIHMQRAMIILSLVSIPLAVIWANTSIILKTLGQDPAISEEAGLYARFMIPGLFAYGLLQCKVKFLQTQNIVLPMMVISGITTLLHIFVCWILVFKSGLGSRGAALANSISYWINVVLLALYVKFTSSCSKTWTGFSKEALKNIPTFLKLAVPSAVMVCLELWSFEMTVLLSGFLPNPQLEISVLSIRSNLHNFGLSNDMVPRKLLPKLPGNTLKGYTVLPLKRFRIIWVKHFRLSTAANCWMIPFGLSGSISTRVSNELGAGHPQTARLAVYVVFVMAVVEGILVGLALILIRSFCGYAYSNEVEVVKYLATMMPILATSNFVYGLQSVLSGVVRGCGWQKIGAYINLGSYYLVGLPCAVFLAFTLHIGGKGLWFGILCALVVQVFFLLIVAIRINWKEEAKKAKDRVYNSTIPVDLVS